MPSIRLILFFLGVESAIGVPTLEHNLSRPRDEILNFDDFQPAAPLGSLPRAELLPAGSHEEGVLKSRKRARVDQPSAAPMAEPDSLGIQGGFRTQVMSPVAADRIGHERPIIPSNRSQEEKRVGNEQPVTVGNPQGPLGHLRPDFFAFHSNVGSNVGNIGLWNHGQVPGRDQPYTKQHGVVIPQGQDINHYPSLDQIPQFNPQFSSFLPSSLESSSGVLPVDPNLSSEDCLQEYLDDPRNLVAFDHISNEHAESQQLPMEAVIDHSAHFHLPENQVYDQAHDLINPDAGLPKSPDQVHHINTNPARGFGKESRPDFHEIKKLLTQEIESGLKRVNTQIYLKIGHFKLYDVHDGNYPPISWVTSQDVEQELLEYERSMHEKVLNWMTHNMPSVPTAMSHETTLILQKLEQIEKQEPYLQKKFWETWLPLSTVYFNMIKYTKIENLLIVSFIDQKSLKAIAPDKFKHRLDTFMNKVEVYSARIFEYLSASSKGNLPCVVTQGNFLTWVSHAIFADQKHQKDFKIPIFGSFSQELIDTSSYPYYDPLQISIIRSLVISRHDSIFKYQETAMALCGYWLEYTHPEVWVQNFKNHEGYSFFLFEAFRKKS